VATCDHGRPTPEHTLGAHLVVVNDAAGSVADGALAPALEQFRRSGDVEVVPTDGVDDLDRAIQDLEDRTLVVAGGDGSLHLAVARLRAAGVPARLGLLPLGTGNDLARTVGLPWQDVAASARRILDGTPRPYDLIVDDDDTICVNAFHAGVGATAAARAEALKGALAGLAYPVGALLAGLTDGGADAQVTVDGVAVAAERILLVAVCNGASFGGGTLAAPDADPADGRLEVVVSTATGPLARAAFGLALERGTHLDREDVHLARGSEGVIEGEDLRYDIDGELAASGARRRRWRVEPAGWQLVH
jgi:diacylglycerol kinase family enzyme